MSTAIHLSDSRAYITEVRELLQNKTVESMVAMVADSSMRMSGYSANPKLLSQGIFYPPDYCRALEETKQNTRLNWLRERGYFFHGYARPKHFMIQDDPSSPTGKTVGFILKKDVSPSNALDQIGGEGLALLGCGEICQIAQYQAIRQVLGDEKFDFLFAADSSTPLMVGSRLSDNPISKVRNYLLSPYSEEAEVKRGDVVFFQNTGRYLSKHPHGMAVGYNTICVDVSSGDEKFTALGIPSEGMSVKGMKQTLVRNYNETPTDFNYLSQAHQEAFFTCLGPECLEILKILSEDRIEEDEVGESKINCELDAEKIAQLANADCTSARKLLASYPVKVGSRRK